MGELREEEHEKRRFPSTDERKQEEPPAMMVVDTTGMKPRMYVGKTSWGYGSLRTKRRERLGKERQRKSGYHQWKARGIWVGKKDVELRVTPERGRKSVARIAPRAAREGEPGAARERERNRHAPRRSDAR